jgi:hypothetical protein
VHDIFCNRLMFQCCSTELQHFILVILVLNPNKLDASCSGNEVSQNSLIVLILSVEVN